MCIRKLSRNFIMIRYVYRLHHDLEAGTGYIQPSAKGPRIMQVPYLTNGMVQLTCTMALRYSNSMKTNF